MDKFLNRKDFDVEPKNPSEEALRRWRYAGSVVNNPCRRFRMVVDLTKRSEDEKKKLKILEKNRVALYVHKAALRFIDGTKVQDGSGKMCGEDETPHGVTTIIEIGIDHQGNDTMEDEIRISVPSGGTETHQRTGHEHDTLKKVTLKWIFVISNLILELSSVTFDQLSERTPHFALIALGTSFGTLVICVIELVCKGRNENVTWRLYCFYHPNHRPLGTFKDIVGLVCATCQVISSSISYTLYCLHGRISIKISITSIVFAMCSFLSNFLNDHDKVARNTLEAV